MDVITTFTFKLKVEDREYTLRADASGKEMAAIKVKNDLRDLLQQMDAEYPGNG